MVAHRVDAGRAGAQSKESVMKIFEHVRLLFKQSAVTRAITLLVMPGEAVTMKKDIETFMDEGFERCVTVYSCVMEIARASAGIPWLLYQRRNKKEIEDHPLLSLLRRPNPWEGQAAFIEKLVAYLQITGNTYLERVGPDSRPPRELYVLRPDRMEVIPDSKNYIAGYQYKTGVVRQKFLKGEVLHMKLFAATDDWYGLSPIWVAARDIDQDTTSKKWNYNLLKNDARPPGAVTTEASLGDDQYTRLKSQIQEKYSGADNAGRPLLLEAGLSWIPFGFNPKDMDWIAGSKLSRQQICATYQVPPELIGDHEHATYSNYQEARKAFYLETVLPAMDKLRDELNNWLTPLFGDDLYLDYDPDQIEALQEDQQKKWDRLQKSDWLTINEKRTATGYEAIDGGDVILIPATMAPIDSTAQEPDGDDE